jgi:hypothetical protein
MSLARCIHHRVVSSDGRAHCVGQVLAVLDWDRAEVLGDSEVIGSDRSDDPDAARDSELGGDGAN